MMIWQFSKEVHLKTRTFWENTIQKFDTIIITKLE